MLNEYFQRYSRSLIEIRRHLHSIPELSREEKETSCYISQKLDNLGIPYVAGVGGHGIVATILGNAEGSSVALRAEMDALAICESTDLPYSSTVPGKMHACGHDGHMAMLLGAATYLAETRNFPGVVRIIFQPAEERFGGAQAMIDDGILEKYPFDSIFSLHNWPGIAVGQIVVHDGPVMAGTNEFEVVFTAPGAHGAMPHLSGDPILAGGYLLTAIQQIVSRSVNPLEPAVVTIGSFHAGAAQNIIPGEAKLTGTYRAFSMELLMQLRHRIERAVEFAAAVTGTVGVLRLDGCDFPPVINSQREANKVRSVVEHLFGSEHLTRLPPTMTGDDFGIFTALRPGAYIWIGNGTDSADLHQASYDFNDEILAQGAQLLAGVAEEVLRNAH